MKPFVIGVAGPTCGGKTTTCNMISKQVGHLVVVVSQDRYYYGGDASTNFDVPESLDWKRLFHDIQSLKNGERTCVPRYNFTTHSREVKEDVLEPASIILLEGILIFCEKSLDKLFDLKVYVDADSDTCLIRRIRRDQVERGRTPEQTMVQWETHVKESMIEYVKQSKRCANIIITNNESGIKEGADCLVSYIKSLIQERQRS
jgi:uridine kinase